VTLPQAVRDDDDWGSVVDLVFVFRVEATQGGFDTEDLEYRGRESPAVDPLSGRTVLFSAQTLADAREGSHPFEGLALLSKRGVGRKVHAVAGVFVVCGHSPDRDERVGIVKGQGTQQRGVDQTEDHGIRADAQRQRECSDDGDAGTLDQHPQSIVEVLPEGLHWVGASLNS
jgi:hypothetical protein